MSSTKFDTAVDVLDPRPAQDKVWITLTIPDTRDQEVNAVAWCVAALGMVPDVNARARIIDYLRDRFGDRVEVKP